jgi:hypothetical protein
MFYTLYYHVDNQKTKVEDLNYASFILEISLCGIFKCILDLDGWQMDRTHLMISILYSKQQLANDEQYL